MKDYSIKSILSEIQKIQLNDWGVRQISVNTYTGILNIAVFEKDYDQKEDGDIKNFSFYIYDDDYQREAEWKRLMDYYNG